jgi:(p)ppGpp synthase/HD superfamily hydrolase
VTDTAAAAGNLAAPILGDRFAAGICLAIELHCQQARKGGQIPYLGHLLGVCALVIDAGGSEEEAIAAVLHDAVEDQGGLATLDRIREQFGDTVADIVDECSDSTVTPKPEWRVRKQRYIDRLREAGPATLRVSAADKLNNLRSIVRDYRAHGDNLWSRFNAGVDGQLWYYGELLKIYEHQPGGPLTSELRQTYDELTDLLRCAPPP